MRITKLHILSLFLLAGMGVVGFYFWKTKKTQMTLDDERARLEYAAQRRAQEESLKKMAEAAKAAQSAEQSGAPAAPAEQPNPSENKTSPVTYTVKKGDTLWSIAKMKEHFGKGHRWYDIWKANDNLVS